MLGSGLAAHHSAPEALFAIWNEDEEPATLYVLTIEPAGSLPATPAAA